MNFSVPDSILGRQRCRQWTPLLTQQLRLRHLYQILVYNVKPRGSGSFYYTLHLTTMCAPFYTSEKVVGLSPKWVELDANNLPYPSVSAFVLRIWQTQEEEMDIVIMTWGVHLSGLVYLGTRLSEIQPASFMENSVIFNLRGGYFSSHNALRTDLHKPFPFIDYLNLLSNETETNIYRNTVLKSTKNEVKHGYNVGKLQKLHSLQITLKNKSLDVESLIEKLTSICGLCDSDQIAAEPVEDPSPIHRHPTQLLTMTTLNKMLQWQGKPTKLQRQRIANLNKEIEIAKFKTKLLAHERDKKSALLRQLKQNYSILLDENEEKGSVLMENYHKLSRDSEKLKEWRKEYIKLKELLQHTNTQLFHRRQQLINQLLFIYPIQEVAPQKYTINGIYLPHSDSLSDCSDGGLAVALGYVSHILLMVSSFLQVPLRYPITYFGSRSHICDHITVSLSDKDRDFPLYTKGKDKMQFNYAVYLLNKNIAQLRWICGQQTPNLRTTLPNLSSFLQGRETKYPGSFLRSNSKKSITTNESKSDAGSSTEKRLDFSLFSDVERSQSPFKRNNKRRNEATCSKSNESRPGLSEILAIPEAFMTKQISSNAFMSYVSEEGFKKLSSTENKQEKDHLQITKSQSSCDRVKFPVQIASFDSDAIEQGTDILHSSLNLAYDAKTDVDSALIMEGHPKSTRTNVDNSERLLKQNRRISRSVGSITDEGNLELHSSLELGSDPLLNVSVVETPKNFSIPNLHLNSSSGDNNVEDGQQDFLQKWLDSGPALVCSEENLYPDEILGTTASTSDDSPLTLRTDALLNTTSFNLIKPK